MHTYAKKKPQDTMNSYMYKTNDNFIDLLARF